MQVERFRLFRQDIRDLVELTVGKMDLYHMVGCLVCTYDLSRLASAVLLQHIHVMRRAFHSNDQHLLLRGLL